MKRSVRIWAKIIVMITVALLFLPSCKKQEESEVVKDVQGNVYKTVTIGNQVWMKENLRTGSYRDGSWLLTNLYSDFEWAGAAEACCIYHPSYVDGLDNESGVLNAYGRLYNWYAVTDSRGLCPVGWRIPTEADWEELIDYLGGAEVAGGKLKSRRTVPDAHPRWEDPNTDASDAVSFAALPSGYRSSLGSYEGIGEYACWWSSTEYDANYAYSYYIYSGDTYLELSNDRKRAGYSVRCIKE
jgi:uncharacterized protein (TIGR02145 family)